jgi:uncharacterized repeat protein (TIGR01451 family)
MHRLLGRLTRAALLAAALVLPMREPALGQQAARSQALLEVQQKLPALAPAQPAFLEIHVRNRGNAAADDVRVTASVPKGWAVLEIEPKSELSSNGLRWSLGTLEAQGLRVLRVRLSPAAGEPAPAELRSDVNVAYQARVADSATAAMKRPGSEQRTVPLSSTGQSPAPSFGIPKLKLRVTGPDATSVGETASLVIDVTNTGGTEAVDVTLQTILPFGLTHPGGNDLELEVGGLQPGETRRVPLILTPSQAGEFRHRIRATLDGAIAAEREICLSVADCKIAMEANGPRRLCPQWTGTFELLVRNDDKQPMQQVEVTVEIPKGLDVVLIGDDGSYDPKNRTIRWSVSGLKPDELQTFVWSVIARAVGDQVCQIQVSAGPVTCPPKDGGQCRLGGRARKSLSWRTAVTELPAERQAVPSAVLLEKGTVQLGIGEQSTLPGHWRQSSDEPKPGQPRGPQPSAPKPVPVPELKPIPERLPSSGSGSG